MILCSFQWHSFAVLYFSSSVDSSEWATGMSRVKLGTCSFSRQITSCYPNGHCQKHMIQASGNSSGYQAPRIYFLSITPGRTRTAVFLVKINKKQRRSVSACKGTYREVGWIQHENLDIDSASGTQNSVIGINFLSNWEPEKSIYHILLETLSWRGIIFSSEKIPSRKFGQHNMRQAWILAEFDSPMQHLELVSSFQNCFGRLHLSQQGCFCFVLFCHCTSGVGVCRIASCVHGRRVF